jgi:hypothetical protein
MGGIFIRTVTGIPLKDPTGGFKCWKVSALKAMRYDTIESAGYSFQLEMNHRAWKTGLKISEIPIIFTDRVKGYSKISAGIAVESIKISLRLRFGKKKKNRESRNRGEREKLFCPPLQIPITTAVDPIRTQNAAAAQPCHRQSKHASPPVLHRRHRPLPVHILFFFNDHSISFLFYLFVYFYYMFVKIP